MKQTKYALWIETSLVRTSKTKNWETIRLRRRLAYDKISKLNELDDKIMSLVNPMKNRIKKESK